MSEPSTADSSTLLTTETAKPFVPRFKCSFVQHQLRIKKMWSEKLHDGKRWKPEAQARYAELEDADQLPETRECNVSRSSSRICERGTKSCTVEHAAAATESQEKSLQTVKIMPVRMWQCVAHPEHLHDEAQWKSCFSCNPKPAAGQSRGVMRAWRILGAALLAEGSLAIAAFVTGPGGLLLGMLPLWMALSLAQDDGAYRKQ